MAILILKTSVIPAPLYITQLSFRFILIIIKEQVVSRVLKMQQIISTVTKNPMYVPEQLLLFTYEDNSLKIKYFLFFQKERE